jgi:hypothetical protein
MAGKPRLGLHGCTADRIRANGPRNPFSCLGNRPARRRSRVGVLCCRKGNRGGSRWRSDARWTLDEPGRVLTHLSEPGTVQEGAGGRTYVVTPANPAAYQSAAPGSVSPEFNVPTDSLFPAGKPEWSVVADPDLRGQADGVVNHILSNPEFADIGMRSNHGSIES